MKGREKEWRIEEGERKKHERNKTNRRGFGARLSEHKVDKALSAFARRLSESETNI